MSDDPVTNKLAMDLIYADETLQDAVETRIREIVRAELVKCLNDSEVARRFLTNNAFEFNRQAVRAVKEFINNPTPIY